MRFVIILLFSILILFTSTRSFAVISLTNGYWSTTFDCDDWSQPNSLNCDGVESQDDSAYSGSQGSLINSAGNHSAGGGGKGYRTYFATTRNEMSSMPRLELPNGITEVWIRWYYRIPSGQSIGGLGEHKLAYLFSTSAGHAIDWPAQGLYQMLLHGTGDGDRYIDELPGGSWQDIYGGATADGRWICFEIHAKFGTGTANGVFDLWVDGVNQVHLTDVDWNATQWNYLLIPHNHNVFQLPGDNPHDVDDIAIATSSYTKFVLDTGGRAMIGPLSEEDEQPPTKGTLLFSESFENTSWAARGWWDDGSSGNAVIASGGQSGNALTWTWAAEADTPTGWGTMRNRLSSAASEFIIEYYVRFTAGWRGSGLDWHPHLIHMMSTEDGDYSGMSSANSDLYFEVHTGTSSPYSIVPRTSHQDELRVNISNGAVPNDLVSTTETRSANHCNTPYTLSAATAYDCYSHSGNYYSANHWVSSDVTIPADEWTKVTAYVKRNTFTDGVGNFDGVMKVWVGDNLAISSEQVLYAAGSYQDTAWDKVVLAPYIGSGSPIEQTMRLDELSIYSVGPGTPVHGGRLSGVLSGGGVMR